MEIIEIAKEFKLRGEALGSERITMGHINDTYRIFCSGDTDYILQRINTRIFRNPYNLTHNILSVTTFLGDKLAKLGGDRERETMTLVETKSGGHLLQKGEDFYRCYICISNATCYNRAEFPGLFRASAEAFGRFQMLLSDFPADELFETIPRFHDTVSRFSDFERSVEANASGRADSCQSEIAFVKARKDYCGLLTSRLADGRLPMRVTHNDTKLNNVMIDDKTHRGVCVIDLDTVMPGSALYDFGDSIRFGASSAAEDEKDLDSVYLDLGKFEEYTAGFLSEAGKTLTEEELKLLPDGAIMMTLECGMRFLADHIDGDKYFALHYENQNLDRAHTQFKLVADMEKKYAEMCEIVARCR